MAKIRFGYSDDFVLKNGKVGINTTEPQQNLDVDGAVKGQDLKVTGISSFTAYEGFLRADHQIAENTTLSFDQGPSASLSGEIIVGTGVTVTIASVGLGTTMVGNGSGTIENTIDTTDVTRAGGSEIECLKVFNTFTPPSGGTNERPYSPKPGELYYNYDLKTIEFFDGNGWRQVDNTSRSGRGVFANGRVGSTPYNTIDMITIPSLGNAVDFGDSTQSAISPAGVGNGTRGIFAGGYAPAPGTTIEYVTMASQGNAISFGSITPAGRRFMSPAASSTRGIFFGGRLNPDSSQTAEIKYIEMGTLGNTEDFGNLSGGADMRGAAASSPTRGVYTSGTQSVPAGDNRNEYVTIAAKSNSIEFGDLCESRQYMAASSNSVRMVIGGGSIHADPAGTTTMDYITIASLGNAIDFGNLTVARYSFSSVSTQTRAVWVGGSDGAPNDNYNVLDYVEISTLGDAMDFGDLTEGRYGTAAVSDSHGGLGGF